MALRVPPGLQGWGHGLSEMLLLANDTAGTDKASDGASPLGTWEAPTPLESIVRVQS